MESLLILLILTGLGSDRRVAMLPDTLKVKVGDDATLQCPLMDSSRLATVSWYRQTAGRSPLLVLSYHLTNTSAVTYGPGVHPNKFTARVDGSLLLHGSEESDSALYFCGLTKYKTHFNPTPRR
ncbi:secreted immunoglobulin domain 1 [Diretmus argenteus]